MQILQSPHTTNRLTSAMTMHHPYMHLLQKRRVSEPEKLARKEKLRTTTLHSKPDTTPNKRRPVRRRSTVSLPFNHLRSRTWAPQPEELTHCRPPPHVALEQKLGAIPTSTLAKGHLIRCFLLGLKTPMKPLPLAVQG